MQVEIRLFATFRQYLPKDSQNFSCKKTFEKETSVDEIADELKLPPDIPKITIVNGNNVSGNFILKDRDVLSIFPPIAGG
jgi:molybdopterin converting factor small subunit